MNEPAEWQPPGSTYEPEPFEEHNRRARWINNAFWLLTGALISKLSAPWIAVALGGLIALCAIVLLAGWQLGRLHHPGCPGIPAPSRFENWLWAVFMRVWRGITGEKDYYP